eukprot:gb/GECG01014445.1/.p1 GENE.gb/GECG01014445.1/~~gb/GECG01014445.1/.p1  ORF type:complete len:552 (+),score=60.37 gb/GECG01014445.1/:1-1656(+)
MLKWTRLATTLPIHGTPGTGLPSFAGSVRWISVSRIYRMAMFTDLGLRSELEHGLQAKCQIEEPTSIQTQAIPAILSRRREIMIKSGTGSGKSLAYILPIIELLKRDEMEQMIVPRKGRPRAVVLAPTRELVEQLAQVTKCFTHFAKFSSSDAVGGASKKTSRHHIDKPMDMLFSTPGKLRKLLDDKVIGLNDTQYIVIDEADTLLHPNNGFREDVDRLLYSASKENQLQVVLCAATTDKNAQHSIHRTFPKAMEIVDESTHKKPSQLTHHFIRVPKGGEWKHQALLDAIRVTDETFRKDATRSLPSSDVEELLPRKIVFCNTTQSVRSTGHFLQENGVDNVCLHKDMPGQLRTSQFQKFKKGQKRTLVCTDAAARGLDIAGAVHVIMFDFPLNAVEYLHRCGRTSRAGTPGIATSLVTKRDEVLASAIEAASENNLQLIGLSSHKEDYMPRSNEKRRKAYEAGKPALLRKRRLPSKRREELARKSTSSSSRDGGVTRLRSKTHQEDRGIRDKTGVQPRYKVAKSENIMEYLADPTLLSSVQRMAKHQTNK